jgi:hypothetical protein
MVLYWRVYFFFLVICLTVVPVHAVDISWHNNFTFYGDNTEFFEPFRTRETILGQQGKTWLQIQLGPYNSIHLGVLGDFRSDGNPTVTTYPVLSFEYHRDSTTLVMGTLETDVPQDLLKPMKNSVESYYRHGFLEPLQVTTLEFTRPVEYGIQWMESNPVYHQDLYLNWQLLNTPGVPETMDYGGTLTEKIDDHLYFEQQMHGYHEGGKLDFVVLYNNWVPAVGFKWKDQIGSLGDFQMEAFGIASATLGNDNLSNAAWGGGGYVRPSLMPGDGWEIFGIAWRARDFYSQEGDSNYNSTAPSGYYLADRFYAELGAHKSFPMEGDSTFVTELRAHWIEQYWAYSFRLAIYAPFDLPEILADNKNGKNHDSSSN